MENNNEDISNEEVGPSGENTNEIILSVMQAGSIADHYDDNDDGDDSHDDGRYNNDDSSDSGIIVSNNDNFLSSFDDSSSDEEDDYQVPRYNIAKSWTDFKDTWISTESVSNFKDKYYYQYAFLAHALGINILYSNSVNQHLNSYKKEYLTLEDDIITKDDLINIFKDFITSLLENSIFFFNGAYRGLSRRLTVNFTTIYASDIIEARQTNADIYIYRYIYRRWRGRSID
jgi:hypothetical protein